MTRKLFSLDTSNLYSNIAHNSILLVPKIDGIKILDLFMFDQTGDRINIIQSSVSLDKNTVFTYDITSSTDLWIDISHEAIESMNIDDIISVSLSTTNFTEYAKIEFDEAEMSFHKYVSCGYVIENQGDSFVNLSLGLRVYDRFENLISTDTVYIGLNDDNVVLKKQTGGTSVVLQLEPKIDTLLVLISGEQTTEFTVENKTVHVDIPDGVTCYVLYQPLYISQQGFVKISETVSINSNNEIRFEIDNGSILKYKAEVEIVNTDISNIYSTPVIKNIAIIASDK